MNATEKKYVEKLKEYIEEILKYKFVIPMDMYDKFESEISALEQQINNLKGDYGHDPSITSFDTKYPMRSESKTAKTAEEILLKHIGKAYNCRSVFHNRYIAAMEEYRQQHQKESKYCDCEQPDREIGYSYCHTCHRMVSDERIELILNQGSTAQQPQKVEQEEEKPTDEEIEKFVKDFGNYYMQTDNKFEQCVDYFKKWISTNLKY